MLEWSCWLQGGEYPRRPAGQGQRERWRSCPMNPAKKRWCLSWGHLWDKTQALLNLQALTHPHPFHIYHSFHIWLVQRISRVCFSSSKPNFGSSLHSLLNISHCPFLPQGSNSSHHALQARIYTGPSPTILKVSQGWPPLCGAPAPSHLIS